MASGRFKLVKFVHKRRPATAMRTCPESRTVACVQTGTSIGVFGLAQAQSCFACMHGMLLLLLACRRVGDVVVVANVVLMKHHYFVHIRPRPGVHPSEGS